MSRRTGCSTGSTVFRVRLSVDALAGAKAETRGAFACASLAGLATGACVATTSTVCDIVLGIYAKTTAVRCSCGTATLGRCTGLRDWTRFAAS